MRHHLPALGMLLLAALCGALAKRRFVPIGPERQRINRCLIVQEILLRLGHEGELDLRLELVRHLQILIHFLAIVLHK